MKKLIALVVILTCGYFLYNNLSGNQSQEKEQEENVASHSHSPEKKQEKSHSHNHAHVTHSHESKKVPNKTIREVPIPTDDDGKSLEKFSNVISDLSSERIDIEELKDYLTDLGLNIDVATDSNPQTGEMAIVRTRNTLPGTRYFHAQVFKDENGDSFIQHVSFEYRPGKDAFEQAVAVTRKQFGLNRAPDVSRDDFASWNTKSGHVIWVKKMSKDDLQNDPFNAYTDSDVGTIKVAKELEIH
jgi:hypothetical protein